MNPLNHIAHRHEVTEQRLTEWARWVRVRPQGTPVHPMFKGYQSKARHWDIEPHIHIAINTLAAHEVEKVVSQLPDRRRTALRWAYVWPGLHTNVVRRALGVTQEALGALLADGIGMVANRLRAGD